MAKYYTLKEIAESFGFDIQTTRKIVLQNIPYYQFMSKGAIRVYEDDLNDYLNRVRRNPNERSMDKLKA